MASRDEQLAAELVARCHDARRQLTQDMAAAGLHEHDGWRISESTRTRGGKTELVFRPIHRVHPSPQGMECVVSIDEPGLVIETVCTT